MKIRTPFISVCPAAIDSGFRYFAAGPAPDAVTSLA